MLNVSRNKRIVNTSSMYSFMDEFSNEVSARKCIESQLWGDKPICCHCGSRNSFPRPQRKGYRCKKCLKDFSIRYSTIFENSRLPLHKWLYAIYLVKTARKGISSLQLSKELDVTQKTAWFLLHRIRESCRCDAAKILSRVVEIDESYFGGLEKNKHKENKVKHNQGRIAKNKMAVVGMGSPKEGIVTKSIDNASNIGLHR